jgi:hypothetical protein
MIEAVKPERPRRIIKVVVLLAPDRMSPVSHTPLSLVEVWTSLSLLRQVTVVPLATVRVAGLNELEPMTTVLGGILDGAGLEVGESLLHPSTPKIMKPIMRATGKKMFLFKVFLLLLLVFLHRALGNVYALVKSRFGD